MSNVRFFFGGGFRDRIDCNGAWFGTHSKFFDTPGSTHMGHGFRVIKRMEKL